MKTINKPPENQIYHSYGLFYFTSLIPISLIYAALIIFYRQNNYFPYFDELGIDPLGKKFIEVGFNACAWIMLPTFFFIDGVIQICIKKNKSKETDNKDIKNNHSFNIYRILTIISATISFFSCIAYGSIIISSYLNFYYICETIFLISTATYFIFVNFMFDILKISKKKEIPLCEKSSIGLVDWIHASSGLFLFSLSYFLQNNFIQSNDITLCISKTLQYIGITLIFLNFIRIHLRMPEIHFFLSYQKKN